LSSAGALDIDTVETAVGDDAHAQEGGAAEGYAFEGIVQTGEAGQA
jgi:hypothetical protein